VFSFSFKELFKINNLTVMIDRLSKIYTVSTVVDTRDDSLHLFLGPYHLTLGPAIFGALHFKSVSAALLASSHPKTINDNTNQYKKRRHDNVLRRFRRSVRKLILIKSILDQLRLSSILTPCNQYELYTQGIYDLVLAGHIHNSHSVYDDDSFTEQIKYFRVMGKIEKENTLLASKFVKINALLHLLSPITQQQVDSNSTTGKIPQTVSDDSSTFQNNQNQSKALIDSTNICCAQHCQTMPVVMYPVTRGASFQSNNLLPPEPRSNRRNTHRRSRRSSIQSNQTTVNFVYIFK
jgi:hypothetical protein